jgi:hypothetical protein
LKRFRGAFPDDRGQLFAERSIHFVEHGLCHRKRVGERLAHTDCLRPCPGNVNAAVMEIPQMRRL